MINQSTILFLVFFTMFAGVHYLAMMASLYWYYWWFDILMHFWGGVMLGWSVYILSKINGLRISTNLKTILFVLLVATISWEIFEYTNGMYDPKTHTMDTAQDIILGFSGGLLAHIFLRRRIQ